MASERLINQTQRSSSDLTTFALYLTSKKMEKLLEELNSEQVKAVTHLDGPVLIVAGPGSGKTRVLTHRVAYLIGQGVAPENILAVTFTNKAANEMKERIAKLISSGNSYNHRLPTVGTFHSVCAKILRQEIEALGWKRDFVIFDDKDSLNMIKKIMADLSLSEDQFNPNAIYGLISQQKSELGNAAAFAANATDYFPEIAAKIWTPYEERLKKNNAVDFDDLLLLPVKLFMEDAKLLAKYQEKFKYILVDEYQDTNHAQYSLIKLLAAKYRNLFVIGDESQNIYSWRGADFRNLLNFEKDYPEAQEILLEQNYRSTQNILTAAHQIIIKNKFRKEKKLWTENEDGSPITLFGASDEREEGSYIINEIRHHKKNKPSLRLSDFTILYRTNAQSRAIEEAFLKAGLPYKVVGGLKFYDRKEVKDMIAYIRLIQNPKDSLAMERIINVPPRGFGRAKLDYNHAQRGGEEIEIIDLENPNKELTPQKARAWKNFSDLMQNLRESAAKLPLSKLLKLIIAKTEYEKFIKEKGKKEEGEDRWDNLKELFSVTKKYDVPSVALAEEGESSEVPQGGTKEGASSSANTLAHRNAIQTFLEEASLMSNQDEVDTEHNLVNLMTLHCAKGLEFPVVFIAGCEEGIFPHSRSLIDAWQMEEERRLCYVGITRAKEKLYLIAARARQLFGSTIVNPPSRFLDDIPPHLIEYINFGNDKDNLDEDGIERPF